MKRYSVLTYIFDNYDIPREIKIKDPEAEYILITDNPEMKSDYWDIIYDESLKDLSSFDKCYSVRFNCFKYCNTDICVRLDGCVGINDSLKPIIDDFENGNYDCSLMIHPYRNNFIEEYNTWIVSRGYSLFQAQKCINIMKFLGYDFSYKGMFQGCFSISRRGELTDSIDKLTLFIMKIAGSNGKIERIDQTILSMVINKYFNYIKVMPVGEDLFHSKYFTFYNHNSMTERDYFNDKIIEPYMFNKPCVLKNYE